MRGTFPQCWGIFGSGHCRCGVGYFLGTFWWRDISTVIADFTPSPNPSWHRHATLAVIYNHFLRMCHIMCGIACEARYVGRKAPCHGRITWRSARVLRGRAWATRGSSVSIYIEIHRFENISVNHTKKWQHTKHKHMHTRKYLWYKCNTTRIKL